MGRNGKDWSAETVHLNSFSKAGRTLLDVRWPGPDVSYRVLRQSWVGLPSYPPSGAVRKSKGKSTVYASWDGATQVASWRVLAGSSTKNLNAVASKNKSGFETTIPLNSSFKAYEVQALDGRHHVLGSSNAFPTRSSNSGLPGAY